MGKRKAAEDDILAILQSRQDEKSGLGTKESKLRQLEKER